MEIIQMNKQGIIPDKLTDVDLTKVVEEIGYMNAAGQESLTRFDNTRKKERIHPRRPQVAPVKPVNRVAPENRPKITVIKKS